MFIKNWNITNWSNSSHVISAAEIAQLGERQTEDLKVPGSIPGFGTETTGGLPIFYFIFLIYVFVFIFIIQPKIYVVFFAFYWTDPRTSDYRRNSLSPHVLTKQNVTSCHLVMLYLGCQEKQHKINIKWQLRKTRKSSHTGNRTRAAWVKARNPNH